MSRRLVRLRGVTLVELMVGIAISMVIAIALLALLANVNRNNLELQRTNSVIENGRFALQLLDSQLTHAGFWGGYVPAFDDLSAKTAPTDFPSGVPDPCPTTAPSTWAASYKTALIGVPVSVYQVNSSSAVVLPTTQLLSDGTSAAPASGLCSFLSNLQKNTDILVVRHVAPCEASFTATDTDCAKTAGSLGTGAYFQFSRCGSDANSYVLSTAIADFTLRNGTCGSALAGPNYCFADPMPSNCAPLFKYITTYYWVRNYFSTSGDGIPTLMRTRVTYTSGTGVPSYATTNTDALVDGIEVLRVELGVDNYPKPSTSGGTATAALTAASFGSVPTFASSSNYYTPTNRGDGNADTYYACTATGSPCQTALNLANTVTMKMFVLARASSTTPNYKDSKVYCLTGTCASTTVNSCSSSGTNDNLTVYGPYCDAYKRHVYTQTVRLNNLSMRREVPTTW